MALLLEPTYLFTNSDTSHRTMSNQLKLIALDAEDLAVLSAHTQDAVLKANEIEYIAVEGQLAFPLHRFAWEAETAKRLFFKKYERRLALLQFSKVKNVRTKNITRNDANQVLNLLAIIFTPSAAKDDPAGSIEFTFAGDAAIVIEVECIEAKLSDLGAAWAARAKPKHERIEDEHIQGQGSGKGFS
ncbi:MAG: DUF2948 family protein [Rhizobiaceae bacterium]